MRKFLSTPSARRATSLPHLSRRAPTDFYPRPLRGGRPARGEPQGREHYISIHALCEEGDVPAVVILAVCRAKFLSTPSARRATTHRSIPERPETISIHALCEEGDPSSSTPNSRTSRFLSTPSARRATRRPSRRTTESGNFYPRPLRGGRQQKQRQNLYFQTNYTTFCTNLEEP